MIGLHLLKHPVFKSLANSIIDKLRSSVLLRRAHPWQNFSKEIQFAIKVAGPLLKCQNAVSLNVAKTELAKVKSIKINGNASGSDHQAWLKVRGMVLCAQATKIDRLCLLRKEKFL